MSSIIFKTPHFPRTFNCETVYRRSTGMQLSASFELPPLPANCLLWPEFPLNMGSDRHHTARHAGKTYTDKPRSWHGFERTSQATYAYCSSWSGGSQLMPISDHRLERALGIAAQVVDLFGEKYWPIVERLESELEARRNRQSRLRTYLQMERSTKRKESTAESQKIARASSGYGSTNAPQTFHSDITF